MLKKYAESITWQTQRNKQQQTVYGQDILSRLDHIKASITSIFGSILKMDSTKKVNIFDR